VDAWGEFFFTDIPNAGYAPNEQLNLYFEYMPKSADGDYELWVPIVKADVKTDVKTNV
jgi:predicted transcriptional regulator YdeE